MTEDMKQRIINAANQALKNSHEDNNWVDRTEVETEVLAGLLKLVQEQRRIGMTTAINEEMHLEKEWFKEAKQQTLDTLTQFIDHLMTDYQHDYGTICHAIAAAALAAAYAADQSPQGGITGFQAGFIMWDFIKQWVYPSNTCGLKIIDYDEMLYPQYEQYFNKTIDSHTWELLQAQAKELLNTEAHNAHRKVYEHWESIANGQVPFGYSIGEN